MQSSSLKLNLKLHKTIWVIYGPSLSWVKSCLPRPYYLLLHEVQPVIYDWSIEIGQSKNLNLFAAWALQSVKYLFLFCLPILMSKNERKSGIIFSKWFYKKLYDFFVYSFAKFSKIIILPFFLKSSKNFRTVFLKVFLIKQYCVYHSEPIWLYTI